MAIVSLSLVVIFALADWSLDALDLGGLQQRNGERVAGFLPFLYFSVETFFRIGCGIQTPVGLAWAIVTLESMSHFLIEVVFIAHMATLGLHRFMSLSDRTRLENTLNRF
ncbi:hypothetical protein Q5692_06750 [Microcoleus sp. C2C3]|uniref:hypothetical protein n=1 Tax=unclassified Microcoleus TaxID=2642155 RepID=UPI002FD33CF3